MIHRWFALALFSFACARAQHAPAATAEEPRPSLRLPSGVRPVGVAAELAVDPAQETFSGSEDLELSLDRPLRTLWLNAVGLQVLRVAPPARVLPGADGFVGLQFERELAAGSAAVHVEWTGELSRRDNEGLFRQEENGRWYALTQFEPVGARRVFPCFDEPSFKVPWTLALRIPEADAGYANTPVAGEEPAGAGTKRVRFARTPPLPSYLVAFGVGPFERVDAGRNRSGHPVGIVVTQGKSAWAAVSARSSPRLLDLLEDYFGSAYRYPKLDLIEIPIGGGAMENPGLVTFNQAINLAPPERSTPSFERRAVSVEAHEFAHLWFGDLVTAAWWDDLWLNEAFATWMTGKTVSRYAPAWPAESERVFTLENAIAADQRSSARRIRQPIESVGDMKSAFDSITYSKGASVLHMFEQYLGPEVFQRGVQRYLRTHADQNATAADFFAAVSAEAGRDVAPAFATFVDQPGVPLVSMQLSCAAGRGRLHLEQRRYLPPGAGPAPAGTPWQIPVCVRTDAGKACTLLAQPAGSLELSSCPAWVAPNAGVSGYYRAALDPAAEAALERNAAKLTAPERQQLIFDGLGAVRLGARELGEVAALALSVADDPDRGVVESSLALPGLVRTASLADGGGEETARAWAHRVVSAYGPRLAALGLVPREGEGEEARLLRPRLLSAVGADGGDPRVREEARRLALLWLADHKAVSADVSSALLRLAALDGDEALLGRYLSAVRVEPDRVERQRLLDALGAFPVPLLPRAFALTLAPETDARESLGILSTAAEAPRSRAAAHAFVRDHFDELAARLPRDSGANLVLFGARLCDAAAVPEVDRFFSARAARFDGGPRTFAQAMESMRQCVTLRDRQAKPFAAWLARTEPVR